MEEKKFEKKNEQKIEKEFEKRPFEERKKESERILDAYPNRIPIFCDAGPICKLPKIDKNKFLVPKDLTISQFSYVIRKRIKLKSEEAIFLLAYNNNNHIYLNSTSKIINIYNDYKSEDGFLRIYYSGEAIFG